MAADGVYIAAGIGPDGETVPLRVDETGKVVLDGGSGGNANLSDVTPQSTGLDSEAGVGPDASRDDHVHRLHNHQHSSTAGDGGHVPAGNVSGLAPVATSGLATDVAGLATVGKTGAYPDLTGRPTLSAVAGSGDYNDLINTPSPLSLDYILLRDEKIRNTAGGTFTAGAWQTRDLNTKVSDAGGHVTAFTGNAFTLQAGTYIANIVCPAFYVNQHQARLFNVTDNIEQLLGTTSRAEATTAQGTDTTSIISGVFTIATPKQFRVEHWCTRTQSGSGFGGEGNISTEIYTVVELWKADNAAINASAPVNPQTITVFQDNFNRADTAGGTVGNPQIGTRPYLPNSVWGITSNRLATKSAAGGENLILWGVGHTQYHMQFTIANKGTDAGAVVRCEVAYGGSWWLVRFSGTHYELYFHQENGSYSLISTGTATVTNGDVVRIEVDEITIKVYVNNALDITVDNPTTSTNATVGFRANADSTAAIDDLTVTAVVDVALTNVLSNVSPQTVGTANAAGAGSASSRDDHVHALNNHDHSGTAGHGGAVPYTSVTGLNPVAHTGAYNDLSGLPTIPVAGSTPPEDVSGAAAFAGVSPDFAHADHVHHGTVVGGGTGPTLSNAAPVDTATTPAPGSGVTASRTDHRHRTGNHTHDGSPGSGGGVTIDVSNIIGGPTVVHTGSYNDLLDKPTIPGPSVTPPAATGHDGVAVIGTSPTYSRSDHVHPDTDYLGAMVLLQEQVASNSAQLAFTNWLSADYEVYGMEFENIVPGTDGANPQLQVSTDGGVTWDTGAHYQWSYLQAVAGGTGSGGTDTGGASFIQLTGPITNVANYSLNGNLKLYNPGGSTYKSMIGQFHSRFSSGDARRVGTMLDGAYEQTAAINAIRILMSSGSIASGKVRVYGISKNQPVVGAGHASLYVAESSTPNIVITPNLTDTLIDSMTITVPGSTVGRKAIVNAAVAFTKVSGSLHYGLKLDGTIAFPNTGASSPSGLLLATMGDDTPPSGTMGLDGVTLDIPGDGATHTVTMFYNDSGPQTQATFYKRSMTLMLLPTATGPWNIGSAPAVAQITSRIGHTYTLSGLVDLPSGDVNYINPLVVSIPAGQIVKLVGYSGKLHTTGPVVCKLQKNGVDITGFTAISVSATRAGANPTPVTLVDGDEIELVVTGITGSPANLSFTIFMDYTGVPA